MKIKAYENPEICRELWENHLPVAGIFDLWQVRSCFHQNFSRPMKFITAEENGSLKGLMPLSWNEEDDTYVCFPGETWHGKTWLEQNRLFADSHQTLEAMISEAAGNMNLRYLNWNPLMDEMAAVREDEIGYLFFPGMFDYSMDAFLLCFSGKHRKKMRAELKKLESRQVTYRINELRDIDHLFRLNLESFYDHSYFKDPRFYGSFEHLAAFLKKMGMLRITTLLIGGRVAAVDMGAVFKNTYTLLAGGTDPEFQGVAKMINLHHLEWACRNRFDMVDFLCGEFNWKDRFHLTPRPLFSLSVNRASVPENEIKNEKDRLCA